MVFLHTYLTEVRMLAPHALKGQKLLAQGSALGIIAIGKSPCKGKKPRALPWAKSFCPFRAYWVISTVQVETFKNVFCL